MTATALICAALRSPIIVVSTVPSQGIVRSAKISRNAIFQAQMYQAILVLSVTFSFVFLNGEVGVVVRGGAMDEPMEGC